MNWKDKSQLKYQLGLQRLFTCGWDHWWMPREMQKTIGFPGQSLKAKVDLPCKTVLSTVMWSSWPGLRQRVSKLWDHPWMVMMLGWAWLFTTRDFTLQGHPGFPSSGDMDMPDITTSSRQWLCTIRRALVLFHGQVGRHLLTLSYFTLSLTTIQRKAAVHHLN